MKARASNVNLKDEKNLTANPYTAMNPLAQPFAQYNMASIKKKSKSNPKAERLKRES